MTVWLVGAGNISAEYAKVLNALNCKFITIGRDEYKAKEFGRRWGCEVNYGGIFNYLKSKPTIADYAIVAVGVEELKTITLQLIDYGVKNILVEKPGCCYTTEMAELYNRAIEKNANVFYAYNRRFYTSVLYAEDIIRNDGGVTSFHFEFTEWGHVIEKSGNAPNILSQWFFANSSHVVDLAFYIGGIPKELSCFHSGSLTWHNPSVFSGSGITECGALFSYQANWDAPGRWSLEVLTKHHRLIFRPLEKLQIQTKGSVCISDIDLDNSLDVQFKPGFYLQTKSFLENTHSRLCRIDEQYRNISLIYSNISGYER